MHVDRHLPKDGEDQWGQLNKVVLVTIFVARCYWQWTSRDKKAGKRAKDEKINTFSDAANITVKAYYAQAKIKMTFDGRMRAKNNAST